MCVRVLDVRPGADDSVTSDVAGMLSSIKHQKNYGDIMLNWSRRIEVRTVKVLYIFKEQFSAIHQPAATVADGLLFFSVMLIKMS